MYQNVTFSSYLFKILIVAVLFVFLPIAFSPMATNTTNSYIASCLCFFLIIMVGVKLILGKNSYVKFYAFAYIIQLLIGLAHYLYFVDANYFDTTGEGSSNFWHEYLSCFDSINRLQNARSTYGVFYRMSADEFQGTHPELYHILSFPFYFLSHRWLNYEPLNIFSSLSLSCNIMLWYKHRYVENRNVHNALMFWTAFFPTFLLADTLWRDAFGIYLISVGLVLVLLSESILSKIFSFALLGYASFMQRTVYVILAGVSAFWGNISKTRNTILKLLYAVLGIIATYFLGNIAENVNGENYNSGYVNVMSYLALPIKIIFGMIGPFPWTNFFMAVEANPAFAWQLQDYLMGTFQLAYLFALVYRWNIFSFKNLDTMTLMGICIMLSGFISMQMHIGYISEGLIFTLPWFFSQIGIEYKRYLKDSFLVLVFLNIILLVIGNIGLSSIWK